jgi:ATP-dependent Lon protease
VLPVGGLREKLLAAVRGGIRTVVVPARNSQEVLRLPPEVRRRLEIELVDDFGEGLAVALLPGPNSRMRAALAAQIKTRRTVRRASGPVRPRPRRAR